MLLPITRIKFHEDHYGEETSYYLLPYCKHTEIDMNSIRQISLLKNLKNNSHPYIKIITKNGKTLYTEHKNKYQQNVEEIICNYLEKKCRKAKALAKISSKLDEITKLNSKLDEIIDLLKFSPPTALFAGGIEYQKGKNDFEAKQ